MVISLEAYRSSRARTTTRMAVDAPPAGDRLPLCAHGSGAAVLVVPVTTPPPPQAVSNRVHAALARLYADASLA